MAYSEELAQRVRKVLARRRGVAEMRMMGGLCFTLRGHMCCGVLKDDLVVRVGSQEYGKALAEPYARPMDFTGRPLKGFVFVSPRGNRSDQALRAWLKRAVDFVLTLARKDIEKSQPA